MLKFLLSPFGSVLLVPLFLTFGTETSHGYVKCVDSVFVSVLDTSAITSLFNSSKNYEGSSQSEVMLNGLIMDSSLFFHSCKFERGVDLRGLDRRLVFHFDQCTFRDDFRVAAEVGALSLTISRSTIEGKTDISLVGTDETGLVSATASRTQFRGHVQVEGEFSLFHFGGSQFFRTFAVLDLKKGRGFRLEDCALRDTFRFEGNVRNLSVEKDTFLAPVELKRINTEQWVYLRRNVFADKIGINVENCKFGVFMEQSKFGSQLLFASCDSIPYIGMQRVLLPDSLIFFGWMNSTYIDLLGATPQKQGSKCRISISPILADSVFFNMRNYFLWFPELEYERHNTFSEIDTVSNYWSLDMKYSCYEKFLARFRREGLLDSYREIDIQYHDFKNREAATIADRIGGNLSRIWWLYGYEKYRIFVWSIALWLASGLIAFWKYPTLSRSVYVIEFLREPVIGYKDKGAAFRGRLARSLAYAGFVFYGLSLSRTQFQENAFDCNRWLCLFIVLSHVVGLICIGFIAHIIIA